MARQCVVTGIFVKSSRFYFKRTESVGVEEKEDDLPERRQTTLIGATTPSYGLR